MDGNHNYGDRSSVQQYSSTYSDRLSTEYLESLKPSPNLNHPAENYIRSTNSPARPEELRKANLNPCDLPFAKDAASALDQFNLTKASELLANCGVDSTGLTVDLPKFQNFAEQVAQSELKGQGLDLTLKYGVGRMSAFYLEGMEIK